MFQPIINESFSHLPHVVEALEDPADGAVAAAHQDLVLLDLAKDVQAAQRAAVAEVEYLQMEMEHMYYKTSGDNELRRRESALT